MKKDLTSDDRDTVKPNEEESIEATIGRLQGRVHCDLHRDTEMVGGVDTFAVSLPAEGVFLGEIYAVFACPTCNVEYLIFCGYRGDTAKGRRCKSHPGAFLFVDTGLKYSCPEIGCDYLEPISN
jgi:hypothetical protein